MLGRPYSVRGVVERGEHRFCVNLDCPAQRERRILHLASRAALRIEGLGEKAVTQFVAAGLMDRVEKVFDLDYAAIAQLDGWGEKSATALQAEVEGARHPALDRFLIGLGISGWATAVVTTVTTQSSRGLHGAEKGVASKWAQT